MCWFPLLHNPLTSSLFLVKVFYFHLFIWLRQVSGEACRIFDLGSLAAACELLAATCGI